MITMITMHHMPLSACMRWGHFAMPLQPCLSHSPAPMPHACKCHVRCCPPHADWAKAAGWGRGGAALLKGGKIQGLPAPARQAFRFFLDEYVKVRAQLAVSAGGRGLAPCMHVCTRACGEGGHHGQDSGVPDVRPGNWSGLGLSWAFVLSFSHSLMGSPCLSARVQTHTERHLQLLSSCTSYLIIRAILSHGW